MTQGIKTLVFVGVAGVAAIAAWVSQPKQNDRRPPDQVGKFLFPEFTDPANASSLEVVRFNEDLGELNEFKVARDNSGRWTIPSHGGYPADGENQMKEAATSLIDLEVLGIASQLPGEHKLFGVVEPNREQLSASSEGVGTLISVRDAKGDPLADLIIGGEVRGVNGQRFVRLPNQDPVYVVNIDPKKFSTTFQDWIEKDLLKLNAFDIQNVKLKDYSVVRTTQGFAYDPRLDVALTDNNGTWKLDELKNFQRGKPIPGKLADGEEINKQALDGLKEAVDDLKLVDVRKKPAGLTADLRAGADFMKNREAIDSLFQRGFFPLKIGDAEPEIRAANGEVHVGMKNGVEYVLRFGNIETTGEAADADSLNRYLFVSVRLDESKIAKPKLEELPPLPGDEKNEDAKPADAKPDDAKPDDAKPDDAKPDDAKPDDAKPEDAKPADAKPEDAAGADDELLAERKAERDRIQKANQRKLDEYQDKLNEAKGKVNELNDRFADWYYIIAEDVYKKVHLGRGQIFQQGAGGTGKGYGLDAFRELEQEGIEGGQPDEPPMGGGFPGLPPGLGGGLPPGLGGGR